MTWQEGYSSDPDCRECLPCPANTANPATLSATLAQCVACTHGTGTTGSISTACAQCSAGSYADVAGEGCKPCPAGTVSSAIGAASSATCTPCGAGTVQAGPYIRPLFSSTEAFMWDRECIQGSFRGSWGVLRGG